MSLRLRKAGFSVPAGGVVWTTASLRLRRAGFSVPAGGVVWTTRLCGCAGLASPCPRKAWFGQHVSAAAQGWLLRARGRRGLDNTSLRLRRAGFSVPAGGVVWTTRLCGCAGLASPCPREAWFGQHVSAAAQGWRLEYPPQLLGDVLLSGLPRCSAHSGSRHPWGWESLEAAPLGWPPGVGSPADVSLSPEEYLVQAAGREAGKKTTQDLLDVEPATLSTPELSPSWRPASSQNGSGGE